MSIGSSHCNLSVSGAFVLTFLINCFCKFSFVGDAANSAS